MACCQDIEVTQYTETAVLGLVISQVKESHHGNVLFEEQSWA